MSQARRSGMRPVALVAALLVAGVVLSALAPLLPAEQPARAALGAGAPPPARQAQSGGGTAQRARLSSSSGLPGRAPVRQAWVQGDSVVMAAADTLRSTLQSDGWRAVVAGWPGMHLWAAVQVFSQVRPQMGSAAVIELGDNDCCDGASFGRTIDQAMATLAGMHVIWLTGTVGRPGQDATYAAIRAAALRWPNLEVADWAAVVARHPDAVFSDGVHLTPTGQTLIASFVRDRLDAWYRRAAAGGVNRGPVTAAPATGGAHPRRS